MKLSKYCYMCARSGLALRAIWRPLPIPSLQLPYVRYSSALHRVRLSKSDSANLENFKLCTAYSTSESYNLESLKTFLQQNPNKFHITSLPTDATDVLHVAVSSDNEKEKAGIFFFRRLGSFVCWNMHQDEIIKVRKLLLPYEFGSYESSVTEEEYEQLNVVETRDATSLVDENIHLNNSSSQNQLLLEKFTFSNALALSVKLAMWESSLEEFSESLEHIPKVLKRGSKIGMTRKEVLQKMGELLTLSHQINLYSDVLLTPDFYWDREDLEKLYSKTCAYLEISKRTKVMNEKLNMCSELVSLLRSHLNEQLSHRLEWMIIILITIEILFEVIRLFEK